MLVQLVVGDWSNDGHGQTFTKIVESNFDRDMLKAAFSLGNKRVSYDLKKLLQPYEQNSISIPQLKELISNGLNPENLESIFYDEDKNYPVCPSDFVHMYLTVAKLGHPDLEYTVLEIPSVNIGGYGLFN